HGVDYRFVVQVGQDVADPAGQFAALGFLEAAGGDGRGADAQAGGDERGTRVVRHAVLVHGDEGAPQGGVRVLAGDVLLDQREQEQVVLGATGDHVETALDEHFGHGLGVLHHLLLVGLEFGLQGFLEAHGLGDDHVLQRATLGAREHGGVQLLLDFLVGAGQDQAAARTTQGLVGGGGDHVGERHRVRVHAGGNQTGHVSHVDEQVGTDLVGDGAEAREVEDLRVGAETGDDHFWLVLDSQALDFVVVDQAGVGDAVLHGVVDLAGEVAAGAGGQVAAVGQAHAQYGVARLDQRLEHGGVGLRAGVRLDVGVIGAEQLLGAVDGQLLDDVDVLAAAVITLARVAFGVLVGQHAALGFHHRRAGVVLGGDQLDVLFLALGFLLHGGKEFGIVAGNGQFTAEHGGHLI